MPFVFNPFTGNLDYDSVGAGVTLAGTPDYITISGQAITRALINLTTHVTGILPSANGGTGVNNAGTITNATNTTITGGGTLALAGYTLTVPATGTAALLGTANVFTANQDISNTAPALTLTDTTASTKSLKLLVDANVASFYELAGAAGNILSLDLVNNRVGIGTTSPGAKLEILGSSTGVTKSLIIKDSAGTEYASFRDDGRLSLFGGLVFFYDSTHQYIYGGIGGKSLDIYQSQNEPLIFSTNSIERMKITRDGNVGIAHTAPIRILGIGGLEARNIGMERGTVAETAGFALTINAGGATAAATDKAGGALILQGGLSTGSAESGVTIQGCVAGASGTTDRTQTTMIQVLGNRIGFFNTAAAVQQTGCAVPTDLASAIASITALRTALNTLGLTTVV